MNLWNIVLLNLKNKFLRNPKESFGWISLNLVNKLFFRLVLVCIRKIINKNSKIKLNRFSLIVKIKNLKTSKRKMNKMKLKMTNFNMFNLNK